MITPEGRLVGSHGSIVEHLVENFESLQNGDGLSQNVVVLEAPSGFGKSRIIREFYERLRSLNVDGEGYWPALEQEGNHQTAGVIVDPLPQRKVLGPSSDTFVWKSEALPAFGWWSFNCELISTGDSVGLDSEATDQLNTHSLPLTVSRNKLRGMSGYTGAALATLIDEVKSYTASEVEGKGLEAVQTLIGEVAGLGLWVKLGRTLFRSGRESLKQREQLKSDIDSGSDTVASSLQRARSLAEVLSGLSWSGLPSIIVIEDAHRMGKDLRAMLDALPVGDPRHPVLIVATVWPEGAGKGEFRAWIDPLLAAGRVERIEVPQLARTDLAELIRSYFPEKISTQLALQLAERMESPYIAKLWLTTRSVGREIELSTDEVRLAAILLHENEVPASIRQVYDQRWSELPNEVRNALALAAHATPTDEEIAKYIPGVVDQASRAVDLFATAGLDQSLAPYAWSRADGALNVIRELLMSQVAYRHLSSLLASREMVAFAEAVSAAAGSWLAASRSSHQVHDRGAQLVAARLITNTPGNQNTDDLALATIVLSEALIRADEPQTALALLQPLVSASDRRETRHDIELFSVYGQAAEFRDPREAAEAAQRQEKLLLQQQPARSEALFRARIQSAWSIALATDDWERAGERYRTLLFDLFEEFGEQNALYVEALHDYTQVLLLSDKRVDAMDVFRMLLTAMDRLLGQNHPSTLDVRYDFVQWTGRDESATEMIPLVRELLDELMRRYGRWDHRTIGTRLELVHWLLRTPRDRRGLLPEIDDVIAASEEANGAEHLDTLRSRAARSIYFYRENEARRGLDDARKLLETAQSLFGAKSPETRYFRWLVRTGESYNTTPLTKLADISVTVVAQASVLAPDAIDVAVNLYPVFRSAVPAPSSEALRSKALKDFLATR